MCRIDVVMTQKEFEIKMKQLRPHLFLEAKRILGDEDAAEDMVQDAVLKLWFMRDRLDEYRSLRALSAVMMRHLCLNYLRNEKGRKGEMKLGTAPVVTDQSPEERLIAKEEERELMHLIQMLPDKQQSVLRMKHVDELETGEIARITGMTEPAVRKNLSRARMRILQHFKT